MSVAPVRSAVQDHGTCKLQPSVSRELIDVRVIRQCQALLSACLTAFHHLIHQFFLALLNPQFLHQAFAIEHFLVKDLLSC